MDFKEQKFIKFSAKNVIFSYVSEITPQRLSARGSRR